MASRFEVRSLKDVPRFFLKSLSAWGQVRKAPGALGASLEAQLFNRVFYTLSAWESRDALYTYARTEPHKSIMTGLRETMRVSTFTFWEVPVDGLPIDWKDAKRRIEEQARSNASGEHGTAPGGHGAAH
jgi:heme-degrading monooxygenase HmoA